MSERPVNSFEFVVVAALRAAQLMRGCTPRVPAAHKAVVTAQREVAAGKVFGTLQDGYDPRAKIDLPLVFTVVR